MRISLALAVLMSVSLAACGGGGSSAPGTAATAAPGTGQTSTLSTQETAQTGTEAALSPVETSDSENVTVGGNNFPTLSVGRSTLALGVCTNKHIFTKTILSPTQTQVEHKYFFDAACTQLARDVVEVLTQNSASSMSIDRTATNFNAAALLLSTRKGHFDITGSQNNYSMVHTSQLFIGSSTTATAQFGRQVTVAPQSATVDTLSANSGHTINVGVPSVNEEFGHTGLITGGTETTDASNNVTYAGTHTGTFYKGPLNSLTLSATPPFAVTGATSYGTATMTGSITYDSTGQLTNVALTGTMLSGNTITVTSAGTPLVVSGTIATATGTNVATFSTDAFGDGIITYANGTQAQIMDWHVVK
jgi:hypothetical protein